MKSLAKASRTFFLTSGVVLLAGSIFLLGYTYGYRGQVLRPAYKTPEVVQKKYDEMTEKYAKSLGATLTYCLHEGNERTDKNGILYIVSGSGGYSGENHYFRGTGESIGVHNWSDTINETTNNSPPVNGFNYDCATVAKD